MNLDQPAKTISQIFTIKYLEGKYFDPTWQSQPDFTLFVPLEGKGIRMIGDSIRAFKPRELIFGGPYLPQLWRNDDEYFESDNKKSVTGILIVVSRSFLSETFIKKSRIGKLHDLFQRSAKGLEFYGPVKTESILIMQELLTLSGIRASVKLLNLLNILAETSDYNTISHLEFAVPFKIKDADNMRRVYDFIFRNYRNSIQLSELSEIAGMTKSSFSRFFVVNNNKVLANLVSELRITYAAKLILETDLKISDIALRSGFQTLSNFTTQFKDVMQMLPTHYKKKMNSID